MVCKKMYHTKMSNLKITKNPTECYEAKLQGLVEKRQKIFENNERWRNGLRLVAKEKMANKTLTVDKDPQSGDLYLQLTDDLMEEMGWTVGDTLQWIENEDGTWSLRIKSDAPTMDKT